MDFDLSQDDNMPVPDEMDNDQFAQDNANIPDDLNDLPNEDEENPYDSNFDAGVEANEEEDPKKYIEQLSGKLSQSLNSYQESQPQPDAETAKYAAGMVIKAAIKGLSEDDVTDILNKLKDTESDNETESDEQPDNDDFEPADDDNMDNDMNLDGNDENMSESKEYNINELFQELTSTDNETEIQNKPLRDISFRKKPFTSPKF